MRRTAMAAKRNSLAGKDKGAATFPRPSPQWETLERFGLSDCRQGSGPSGSAKENRPLPCGPAFGSGPSAQQFGFRYGPAGFDRVSLAALGSTQQETGMLQATTRLKGRIGPDQSTRSGACWFRPWRHRCLWRDVLRLLALRARCTNVFSSCRCLA